MNITHAIQILITGKNLTGPAISSAVSGIGTLATAVAGLGVKLAAVAAGAMAGFIFSLGAIALGLLALPKALMIVTDRLTDYAAQLELARRGMLGVLGEDMPAMLASLKQASAFMVPELDVIRMYHQAYMLLGKELAERLPEAMTYLTKVAAVQGDSVDYLMDRLIRSVGRLSTRWMAYIGVVTTIEEATARASEMFGKAADQLSYTEKQAGMLDMALEKLKLRTDVLPEVLGTTKQMAEALKASMTDLGAELTTHFLPVARSIYVVAQRIVNVFKNLISEGGALYGPLRTISATFSVLADIVDEVLSGFILLDEEGSAALTRFANKIISFAWAAFQWGVNISVQLASGIVKGASIALVAAMNFIGSILAWFLGPGSPPRVASNIMDWGASAFTYFLMGFTMADFDVLEGLQAPLKRALKILVDMGEMGGEAAGQYFMGLSEMIAEAIDTGETAAVFATLAEIPGGYGESLVELYERQLLLAQSLNDLADAERRLTAARNAQRAAGKELTQRVREYNKLLLEGASFDVLASKLEEIDAAEESIRLARAEADAAEDLKIAAKEQIDVQEIQVRLQERLLNQLFEMATAMEEFAEAASGAGGAAGGAGAGGAFDGLIPDEFGFPGGLVPSIDAAFEGLKATIRQKFQGLWDQVVKDWEASGGAAAMRTLVDKWNEFRDWFVENSPLIVEKIEAIGNVVKGWMEENLWDWVVQEWDKWVVWWETEGPYLEGLMSGIWDWLIQDPEYWERGLIKPAEELFGAIVEAYLLGVQAALTGVGILTALFRTSWTLIRLYLQDDWDGFWKTISEINIDWGGLINKDFAGTLQKMFPALWQWGVDMVAAFNYTWGLIKEGFNTWAANTWETIKTWAVNTWESFAIWMADTEEAFLTWVVTTIVSIIIWGLKFWKVIENWHTTTGDKIGEWITTTGENFNTWISDTITAIEQWATDFYDKITGAVDSVLAWLTEKTQAFFDAGVNMINGIIDGIGSRLGALIDKARRIAQAAIDAINSVFDTGSPSKVMIDLGKNVVESFAAGMEQSSHLPEAAFNNLFGLTGVGGTSRSSSSSVVNNLYITSNAPVEPIVSDFRLMATMAGV